MEMDLTTLKPEWLRPPCWRWNIIEKMLANPTISLDTLKTDPLLYKGACFYRDVKSFKAKPALYMKKYPELNICREIYNANNFHGWRWYIEALILTGATDKEIVELLKVPVDPAIIGIYRKLFFDVDAILQSSVAVNANILAIARVNQGQQLDCNYMWKIFAYTWGADAFIEHTSPKKQSVNKLHLKWFKDMAKEATVLGTFQMTSDLRAMYNQQVLEVLKIAKDFWDISDEDYSKGVKLAGEGFINELVGHLDMVLLDSKEKLPAIEERTTSKAPIVIDTIFK